MRMFPLVILSLALLAAPARAGAQTLTLEEAFRVALANNYNLRAAREGVDQAYIQRRKAWSIMGPTVSAQASHSWNNEVTAQLPVNDPRQPVLISQAGPGGCTPGAVTQPTPIVSGPACVFSQPSFQDIVVRPGTSQAVSLNGTQPIFVGQFFPALSAANDSIRMARANVESAQETVLYNVASLYFNTVAAEQFTALNRQSFANLREHLAAAQTRFEVGQIPRLGVLQAQIELTRAEAALLRSDNDHRNARAALANLLGVAEIGTLQAPEELVAQQITYEFPENPTDAALSNRADLQATAEQLEMARSGRTANWMKFAPSLVANGQYQKNTDPGAFGAADNWTVMLVLNVPIIQAGTRVFDLQESWSRIRQAEVMLEAKKNEVRLDVQTTRSNLDVTRRNLTVAEQQRQLAQENYAIARVSFENGLATSLDVIDANQALLGAEINFLREQLNLRLDTLNYLRAVGLLRERIIGGEAAEG